MGQTKYSERLPLIPRGLQAIPTSAADLAAKSTYLYQLSLTNTTAGALTITINDKQSTPVALFNAVSLAANSLTIVSWPMGVLMKGGINWVASGAGIKAEVVAGYSPGV